MIKLDIDMIINSPDLGDFEAMVDLWPGAMKVYKFWEGAPCDCGKPDCSRKAMQFQLKALFSGNPDKCIQFFALVDKSFDRPLTLEDYNWAVLQLGANLTQEKINKAWWEVYGGGSLANMPPRGRA